MFRVKSYGQGRGQNTKIGQKLGKISHDTLANPYLPHVTFSDTVHSPLPPLECHVLFE